MKTTQAITARLKEKKEKGMNLEAVVAINDFLNRRKKVGRSLPGNGCKILRGRRLGGTSHIWNTQSLPLPYHRWVYRMLGF